MTTDRSYRRARSVEDAVAEMQACAGSQFSPDVVSALVRVVARSTPELASVRARAVR